VTGFLALLFNIWATEEEVFRKALGKPKTKHYIA
jgi:hypothetical protein